MTLEEEITALTAKWYRYVNIDHHKDRDCHWFIEKVWSYGEDPYYQAYHSGYVLDGWTSPRCGTEEMAATILRDKLKREIESAIKELQSGLDDPELIGWLGQSKESVQKLIEELS